MPTIKFLIRCALDEGRSVRALEHDSGYQVKFQTFQELSTQPPRQFPKELKTIAGMAKALRVSQSAVVLAYAESLGVPLDSQSDFALRLPSDVDRLDVDMQNALIAVVRAAVRSRARYPVKGDELEDGGAWPSAWLPSGDDPRMIRDKNRQQRHKRGS